MTDLLFPPLPDRIVVPFTKPRWNLLAIKALWFTPGLERRVREQLAKIGLRDVTLTDSGTSALYLALREAGVERGDEVVLPSYVCKAVIYAVLAVGATPVYADVDKSFNVTVPSVRKALSRKTKAVIAVHQYGKLCDIRGIGKLCKQRNVPLIEDAAVPIGIKDGDRYVGSFGDYAVLSFNMGKTVVSFGGGALVRKGPTTASPALPRAWTGPSRVLFFLTNIYYKPFFARIYRALCAVGISKRQENIEFLYEQSPASRPVRPARMTRTQLAATLYQLRHLGEIIARQRSVARTYTELLAKTPLRLPDTDRHTCTYYPVRAKDRYALSCALASAGIETQWTFYPLHLQKQFSRYKGSLPLTNKLWKEELSLPMGPTMTDEQARLVCARVREFYA